MSERQSSARRDSGRLAARRRLRRRRVLIALGVILLIAVSGIIYELHQSYIRISRVQIFGADQSLADVALTQMKGSYLGIVPRDSSFFLPESDIRSAISAASPEVEAVSIFHTSLTSISIKVNNRVPVARWCGAALPTVDTGSSTPVEEASNLADCYMFDANGLLYAPADETQSVNAFYVYEALPAQKASSSPVGLTLPKSDTFPAAFDFARQLNSFGSPVTAVVFRADEVDDYLKSGTRVTYVLGNEQNAFTALTSAGTNLNLADGSLDYVDLRFDGKVYLKKK